MVGRDQACIWMSREETEARRGDGRRLAAIEGWGERAPYGTRPVDIPEPEPALRSSAIPEPEAHPGATRAPLVRALPGVLPPVPAKRSPAAKRIALIHDDLVENQRAARARQRDGCEDSGRKGGGCEGDGCEDSGRKGDGCEGGVRDVTIRMKSFQLRMPLLCHRKTISRAAIC